jgi:hypothetical protein
MPDTDCPDGAVCVWQEENFQGGRSDLHTRDTCYNIRFKSIKCNAGVNAVVYPRPNCQGDVAAVLGVGQADSNINGQSVTIQRIIFSPT